MTDVRAGRLGGLLRFVRTPTLGRSVAILLAAALVLLMGANVLNLELSRRAAVLQAEVERTHEVRRTAQRILTLTVDAETGQRGYLLTGRRQYLTVYTEALAALPATLDVLERRLAHSTRQQAPDVA